MNVSVADISGPRQPVDRGEVVEGPDHLRTARRGAAALDEAVEDLFVLHLLDRGLAGDRSSVDVRGEYNVYPSHTFQSRDASEKFVVLKKRNQLHEILLFDNKPRHVSDQMTAQVVS